jgi:hypothetical protein
VSRFAEGTSVPKARSAAHIEELLRRYGVTTYVQGQDDATIAVEFVAHERRIRFTVPMPSLDDPEISRTPTNRPRSPAARILALEAEERRLWRSLHLVLKAKLEATTSGVSSFEQEFLGHTVLPDNRTVAEAVGPRIDEAYRTGEVGAVMAALDRRPELGAGS